MSRRSIGDFGSQRIIAAVRRAEDLKAACASDLPVVFLLVGDLFTVQDYVRQVLDAGKKVFLHVDFINGLGNDPIIVKYLAEKVQPTGIISTKSHLIKHAKKQGLLTIQRMFLIDSAALDNGIANVQQSEPDAVEIMPGLLPRVIAEVSSRLQIPVIAGGLIHHHEEVEAALEAGAAAVSMGSRALWANDRVLTGTADTHVFTNSPIRQHTGVTLHR
ncbi:glycerol-3-phosphate responsive antiterminator [Paenibacillus sp. FJAT-26967]|uniref:glycerol-3-phosphate responsive antiterminator n=1 Tax=Paenibacillus sp. FJAT-26967 TaxID=1729690 RepID=UPI0009FF50EB|nr:glycerol-3-phosphate responsive antiterminator [Paenibacillus sp. FJAT-26967]